MLNFDASLFEEAELPRPPLLLKPSRTPRSKSRSELLNEADEPNEDVATGAELDKMTVLLLLF